MIQVLREIFPLDICKKIMGYMVDEIVETNSLSFNKCIRCNEKGAFCTTPIGGDYISCPKCNNWIETGTNYIDSDICAVYMCPDCKTLFDNCCSHAVNGCSEDVYFARIVTGFYLDDVRYYGTPKFVSLNAIEKIAKSVEIKLIMDCWSTIDKRTFCPGAYYKYSSNPYSYHQGKCSQVTIKVTRIYK